MEQYFKLYGNEINFQGLNKNSRNVEKGDNGKLSIINRLRTGV